MQALIITNKGMEHISQLEVKEILGKESEKDDYVVKFSANKNELKKLKNESKSASRILYLFGETKIEKDLEKTRKNFEKILEPFSLDKFLKNKIYCVDCERIGQHNYKSVDISRNVAKYLIKQGYEKTTFKDPEIIIYIFIINNKGYIGIDISGDLSKRDYKIFNNPKSIKGNIAYALIREAGYEKNKILVDPFCLSGEIVIEAALFEKGKIYAYDKKRNIIAARKNSLIAKVDKEIIFGDYDLSWLDKRHDKSSVDVIATRLPESSKHKNIKFIEKKLKEFFEKSYKIIKNKGKIAVISKDKDIINKQKGKLKILKELIIKSGELNLKITILGKAE